MDYATLQKFESLLKELEATLQAEIDQPDSEADPVKLEGVMGRVSRGDAMQVQQLALEVKRRRRERLQRVQTAFLRMEQGTYGLCSRCQKPIDEVRLEAFPEILLCVKCAA
jgi:DnaK suppressor protein